MLWNNAPTVRCADALSDRLERREVLKAMLGEIEEYLENIGSTERPIGDRAPTIDDILSDEERAHIDAADEESIGRHRHSWKPAAH